MMKIFLYLSTIFFLFSCAEPNPVELFESSDDYQIEIVSSEPDKNVYSTGYDSTGVVQNPLDVSAFISISKVTNTQHHNSNSYAYGSAEFYDKEIPIYLSNGRLLGYRTIAYGDLFINFYKANILNNIKQFIKGNDSRNIGDTLIGKKYSFYKSGKFISDRVFITLDVTATNTLRFDFPSPPEINANISLTGNLHQNNFSFRLTWQSKNAENFNIIIGGIEKHRNELFPIYRIVTEDDGFFIINSSIINGFPFNRFEKIVFTFTRQNQFESYQPEIGSVRVYSQSIHNIGYEIQ